MRLRERMGWRDLLLSEPLPGVGRAEQDLHGKGRVPRGAAGYRPRADDRGSRNSGARVVRLAGEGPEGGAWRHTSLCSSCHHACAGVYCSTLPIRREHWPESVLVTVRRHGQEQREQR